jgi:hypothetical protein
MLLTILGMCTATLQLLASVNWQQSKHMLAGIMQYGVLAHPLRYITDVWCAQQHT